MNRIAWSIYRQSADILIPLTEFRLLYFLLSTEPFSDLEKEMNLLPFSAQFRFTNLIVPDLLSYHRLLPIIHNKKSPFYHLCRCFGIQNLVFVTASLFMCCSLLLSLDPLLHCLCCIWIDSLPYTFWFRRNSMHLCL